MPDTKTKKTEAKAKGERPECSRPECEERFSVGDPGTLVLEVAGQRLPFCCHQCLDHFLHYHPDRTALLEDRLYPPSQHAAMTARS